MKLKFFFIIFFIFISYNPAASQLQFVDESNLRLPLNLPKFNIRDVKLGDIDNDNDLDIIYVGFTGSVMDSCGPSGAQSILLLNNGFGYFTDETLIRFPIDTLPSYKIGLGDIDNDNDLDIYVCNFNWRWLEPIPGQPDLLWINNGFGYFTDESNLRLPNLLQDSFDVVFFDANNDGYLDIAVAIEYSSGPNVLLINDGQGYFAYNSSILPEQGDQQISTGLDFGDIDNDGDFDLFITNTSFRKNYLWFNDSHGSFSDFSSKIPNILDAATDVKLGDLDGDGDLDVVIATEQSLEREKPYFLLNQLFPMDSCFFTLPDSSQLLKNPSYSIEVDLGDVDLDEDLDVLLYNVVPYPYGSVEIYLNLGNATFVKDLTSFPLVLSRPSARSYGEFGDIDNDGDLDMIVGQSDKILIYINKLIDTSVESKLNNNPCEKFSLFVSPNPSNKECYLKFINIEKSFTYLIVDILGRVLYEEKVPLNNYYSNQNIFRTWNGKNYFGENVTSGIYLIIVKDEFGNIISTKKIMRIK